VESSLDIAKREEKRKRKEEENKEREYNIIAC